MPKADSIDALIESAISEFSKYGYEGASLRDIAASANVPLSTINMYFGSKSELYRAVEHKAWAEIDEERSLLLREAYSKNPNLVPLEDIIGALARPVVRRALSQSPHDIARILLVRMRGGDHRVDDADRMMEIAAKSVTRWIDAMTRACPTLSRQDVIWAYSFCIGAIYSWQLIDHRYDSMMGEDRERTVDGVTGDIVAFGCAGIRSMITRRDARIG